MDIFRPSDRFTTAAIFWVAALFATALRVAVIDNDLWLDEVWSVQHAASVESPAEIFFSLHHDNNHHLNTLWLWLCGPDAGPVQQRFLSLVTGILAVLLTGVLTLRWGKPAASSAMLISSASIMFVQYSTEARGYSLALCFALAAHWYLRKHLTDRSLGSALVFGCLCALGTLSHLSFLQYYFAAVFWTSGAFSSERTSLILWCRRMFRCHGLAVLCLASIYLVDVRYLTFGGGPRLNAVSVFVNAVSVFAGGTLDEPSRLLYFVVVAAGIVAGLLKMVRGGQDEWKFFACLFVLFPLFRVVLLPAGLMFERYFLILLGFAAIPISVGAMQLLNGRLTQRAGVGLIAIVFVAGNVLHINKLAQDGRGHYLQTMSLIADESPDAIRISSDHPFRNRLMIEYFAARCPKARTVEYVELGEWNEPPDWMICHHIPRDNDPAFNFFEPDGKPRASLNVSGFKYELRLQTGTAELSGCEWLCYRRTAPTEQASGRMNSIR